jgi:hypothetical protein
VHRPQTENTAAARDAARPRAATLLSCTLRDSIARLLVGRAGRARKLLVSDCEPDLKEAFHVFDPHGTGYISTAALREIVTALAQHLSVEEIDEIVGLTDDLNSGHVSFERFEMLMMMNRRGAEAAAPYGFRRTSLL